MNYIETQRALITAQDSLNEMEKEYKRLKGLNWGKLSASDEMKSVWSDILDTIEYIRGLGYEPQMDYFVL